MDIVFLITHFLALLVGILLKFPASLIVLPLFVLLLKIRGIRAMISSIAVWLLPITLRIDPYATLLPLLMYALAVTRVSSGTVVESGNGWFVLEIKDSLVHDRLRFRGERRVGEKVRVLLGVGFRKIV